MAGKVFGKDFRLRTREQLAHVREQGRSLVGTTCIVAFTPAPCGGRRVGILISRRYSTHAVVRNRARRLCREAYRMLLPELRDAWLVLVPRRRMQGAKLGDVLPEMRRLCARHGLLKSDAAVGTSEENRP